MRVSLTARRTPLIHFLGKRVYPEHVDHTPRVHPQDPHGELPVSFKQYRLRAQQYGPLSTSAIRKGPIAAAPGEHFSRNELPPRYRYIGLDTDEIDLINSGGATTY
ncbi:hypothetical protein V1520DRAFT_273933 [Lipomyces starkeyi]|uniref:37S ribosomal protein YMR-31, mitochondrial n=1 Tax=Lipomyces starkeyi NRRL Y-11557 TaxID=675824 RepID=A0A1E3QFL1_LIPST|nr:hypothetical protein LIPSTDRAFT_1288 [Lipomyces starkeyi NRRL Y-11557]